MKKIITIHTETPTNFLILNTVTNSQLFEIAKLIKENTTIINSNLPNELITVIKKSTGVELELIETIAEYNIRLQVDRNEIIY